MNKKKLFLDMDGTLAKFNSKRNALERFKTEKGFFYNLKPFKNIELINEMVLNNKSSLDIYIISASPNEQADKDKRQWIKKYLSNIEDKNICFCRLGKNKAKEIKEQLNIIIDNNCYLLDDYSNNLFEWKQANGIGIKRLTSLANNSTKKWKGFCIRDLKDLQKIFS